jgi:DNA replication and repair protein RecF
LRVCSLKLSGVRNLEATVLEPGERFNVFHGDNGQGKTNLLEAVYVLCTLRSFRAQRLADIIHVDREGAHLAAQVAREGLERRYELAVSRGSRTVRLDGKSVRPIARYFGDFNVVLFAPEDLQVPRGSPAERRRFLDRAVFNRDASYLGDVQAYEKVLRSRNALLRDLAGRVGGSAELLGVYDDQLAAHGARVTRARADFVAEVRPRLQAAYEAITHAGLAVDVTYQVADELAGPVAAGADPPALAGALAELLRSRRPRDLARGATSAGPHRDDLGFSLEGRGVQSFASQGQLRALVLAWKTAELDLLAEAHGVAPILLLDDVSSELDPARNEYLFDFLRGRDNQCFITTTHPGHVLLAADRVDYELRSGAVKRQNKS